MRPRWPPMSTEPHSPLLSSSLYPRATFRGTSNFRVSMRILVIEDDSRTVDYIVRGFTEAGHVCDALADGRDALFAATRDSYDVIVADRMIPGLDGLSTVKAMRAAGVQSPVLFLTAIGGIDDRVEG